jgi:prepilin-type processing-associated H-X9-DG protein
VKVLVRIAQACLIAIALSVIGAILFPVFYPARPVDGGCAINERQLGLAFAQYAQDYDNRLPPGSASSSPGVGWGVQVYGYLKSTDIYHCPDDVGPMEQPNFGPINISYAYNSNLAARHTAVLASSGVTVLLFESSGSTTNLVSPALDESSPAGNGLDGQLYCGPRRVSSPVRYATGNLGKRPVLPNTQFLSPTGRHAYGANYLFADSHVHWLKPQDVSSGDNALSASDAQAMRKLARRSDELVERRMLSSKQPSAPASTSQNQQ